MSSQGTGTLGKYTFERQLLDQWGLWARHGGAVAGYSRVDLMKKYGPGLIFDEKWLIEADKTIAQLPKNHKRSIKKMFLSRRGNTIPQREREQAIVAFSHEFTFLDSYH